MAEKRFKKHKAEDLAAERRRVEVASLYCQGMFVINIADKLGVTRQTIHKDLRIIKERWREEQVNDIDEKMLNELTKIDEVERNAWEAWERSIGKVKQTKTTDHPKGQTYEELIKEQAGDPRFLFVVLGCVKKRCEILGLNAPEQVKTTLSFGSEKDLEEMERRMGIGVPRWSLPTSKN